ANPLVNDGTIIRTYRINDGNGNTTDVTQNIIIDDTTPPTASNPATITVQCLSAVPAPDVLVVTDEADNCTTPTVTFVSQTANPLVNDGTIIRTYRINDGNGNTIDVTQNIIIDDNTPPTASNPTAITVQCLSAVPAPDVLVVTDEADNCTTPTVTFVSQTANPLVNDGTITRTYRVDDGN
ncbi:HYR-like domain-containing protein, partial [Flavobacterium palustre]